MHTQTSSLFRIASYQTFHSVATVLERFVARAPKSARLDQLVSEIELTAPEISAVCSRLCMAGLIVASGEGSQWTLVGSPGTITLADVFTSAAWDRDDEVIRSNPEGSQSERDLDLLISQAMLTIDQSISTQLRKFQLDRVSTSKYGWSHVT